MEEIQNKYENSLFHYTNAKGLLGIFDSNKLWATAIHCVNDQSELQYFSHILQKKINLRFSEDIYKDMYYALNKQNISINFIQEIADKFFLDFKHFVTCFTLISSDDEYDDGLLSQWRGYGDDGGYAIEFDKSNLEKLSKALNDKKQKIISKKVTYSEQTNGWEWENFFETHIEQKINQKQNELSARTFNDSDKLIAGDEILEYVSLNAPFCKNPHFSEEKEFRISYGIDENIDCNFTNRNGLIIPYIELDFDIISCINRIIIGPSPRSDDRVRSVKALLKSCIEKHELKNINIDVTASNIPFNRE
jgi:hypothetical protein